MSSGPEWRAEVFQHLNLKNEWPGFKLELLTNDSGALRLFKQPAKTRTLDPRFSGIALGAAGLVGPSRVGIDEDGNIYMPDQAHHRILQWRACDGQVSPLVAQQSRVLRVGPLAAMIIAFVMMAAVGSAVWVRHRRGQRAF